MERFDPEQEHLAWRRDAAAQISWRGATLLAWCLWLLGSWLVATLIEASLDRRIRYMMLLVMVGFMVLWPALRLSQDRFRPFFFTDATPRRGFAVASPGSVLIDWLGLALITQAVVWPLTVTAGWTLRQTLWVDAAVLSWGLLVAGLVAWGVRSRHGWGRTVMMVICVALLLGEPLALSFVQSTGESGWSMRISPLFTIWQLSESGGLWSAGPSGRHVLFVALAAAAVWTLVLLMHALGRGMKQRGDAS